MYWTGEFDVGGAPGFAFDLVLCGEDVEMSESGSAMNANIEVRTGQG